MAWENQCPKQILLRVNFRFRVGYEQLLKLVTFYEIIYFLKTNIELAFFISCILQLCLVIEKLKNVELQAVTT